MEPGPRPGHLERPSVTSGSVSAVGSGRVGVEGRRKTATQRAGVGDWWGAWDYGRHGREGIRTGVTLEVR